MACFNWATRALLTTGSSRSLSLIFCNCWASWLRCTASPLALVALAASWLAAGFSALPDADDLRRLDAWWRAANYLSVGQIYLRANPLLKGKVVFELVIRPDGSLAEVNIVQSELNDSKLERQLTLRLRSVNFGAEAVALTRSQWTVEFLPG